MTLKTVLFPIFDPCSHFLEIKKKYRYIICLLHILDFFAAEGRLGQKKHNFRRGVKIIIIFGPLEFSRNFQEFLILVYVISEKNKQSQRN